MRATFGPATNAVAEEKAPLPIAASVQDDTARIFKWTDEMIGLCRGIVADGVIDTAELRTLQDWLMTCPYTHLYPMSAVAEIVESIVEDGIVTEDELEHLKQFINVILETFDGLRSAR